MTKQVKKHKKVKGPRQRGLPFTRTNYLLFGAGFLTLILGYITLSIGPWDSFWSLTLAPILLIIGYVVVFPLAILYHRKEAEEK